MKAAEKNEAGWAGWLAGYATQKAEVLGPGCPRYLAWPHQSVSPASQWEVGGQLTALLQPTTNTTTGDCIRSNHLVSVE